MVPIPADLPDPGYHTPGPVHPPSHHQTPDRRPLHLHHLRRPWQRPTLSFQQPLYGDQRRLVLLNTPWDTTQCQPLPDSLYARHHQRPVFCLSTHFHSNRTAGIDFLKGHGVATWPSQQTKPGQPLRCQHGRMARIGKEGNACLSPSCLRHPRSFGLDGQGSPAPYADAPRQIPAISCFGPMTCPTATLPPADAGR